MAESLDSVRITCLFTERPICLDLAFHDVANAHWAGSGHARAGRCQSPPDVVGTLDN